MQQVTSIGRSRMASMVHDGPAETLEFEATSSAWPERKKQRERVMLSNPHSKQSLKWRWCPLRCRLEFLLAGWGRMLKSTSASDRQSLVYPSYARFNVLATVLAPTLGAPIAVVVACAYGLPVHALISLFAMAYCTGFGT